MRYKVSLTWAAGSMVFGPVWGIDRPVYEVEAANGADAVCKAIKLADEKPGARTGPMQHFGYRVKAAVATPVGGPSEVIEEPEGYDPKGCAR